jgi:hypothetical protein
MTASRLIDAIPMKSAEERRQMRENAHRLTERGGPRAPEARAFLEALDAFEAHDRARRLETPVGSEMTSRVVAAFRQIRMSETERKLVQVVLDHPDASSEWLTAEMEWNDQAWQMHFGKLCERREHLLWTAPFELKRNAPFYSGILADFDETTRGFTLKPAAVEAFAQLGLRPRGSA